MEQLALPSPALPGQSLWTYGLPHRSTRTPDAYNHVQRCSQTNKHTLRNGFCEGLRRLATSLRRRKSVAGRRMHRAVASQKNEV